MHSCQSPSTFFDLGALCLNNLYGMLSRVLTSFPFPYPSMISATLMAQHQENQTPLQFYSEEDDDSFTSSCSTWISCRSTTAEMGRALLSIPSRCSTPL
ncbi:hypothetical protein LIER_15665 [Lithospermum erythrorhizon]|uniref:Uncharacterized protein n=1 Tax=Lithospermum erythrorhizon TaxID=34254 RepID=A0AAV3Q6A1_LITER